MRRRDNREKRARYLIGLFIVVLMVSSTLGFIVGYQGQDSQDNSYNGFEFTQFGQEWLVEADSLTGKKEFAFLFHPLSLNIDIPQEITTKIKQSPSITITFDPNATDVEYVDLARFKLAEFLTSEFGKLVDYSITQNTTVYSFPIESCSDDGQIHVTFVQANDTYASIENNCITLQGLTSIDHIQQSEYIIYQLLEII